MNRFSTLVLLLLLCLPLITFAGGTKELAPNANITINGSPTNDIAALNLDHPEYHNFASYDNPAVTSRLHIHISDPTAEGIFLGFSPGTRNTTGPNAPNVNFEYRVKDPLGNIVFGPVMVTPGSANASTWQLASTGPAPLFAGGYNPENVTSGDLTSGGWMTEGDYYIEFRDLTSSDRFLINYWDITVFEGPVANPTERKGRIWSQNWALFAINDFDFPNRPFNGAFYVCAPDPSDAEAAFITKVDFNNSGFHNFLFPCLKS